MGSPIFGPFTSVSEAEPGNPGGNECNRLRCTPMSGRFGNAELKWTIINNTSNFIGAILAESSKCTMH